VTFRARVIVTTTAAVTVAVLFACLASYLSTHDAIQRSTDESLYSAAAHAQQSGQGETVAGVFFQIVFPNGTALPPSRDLPVDATVLAVARQLHPQVLRTVDVHGSLYRELVVPLPVGTVLRCDDGSCILRTSAAQVFSVNISGQQHQLHILALRLLLLAIVGVLLAVLLGYLAARSALSPLEEVTNEIEGVTRTSNIAYRLAEGSNDELGRLRRVFNELLSSVDLSQRTQRQLVLDASHELRTPLTSLRTNAQVLSQADRLTSSELEQITHDMVAQVDELAALITDLGELARGDETREATEELRFDELVDECVATARTHARTRNVTIDAQLNPCVIEGRRDRVVRAVNNLINNAVKFAAVDGRVTVMLSDGVLQVDDDGPGVAEEDVAFVFDRFWRSPRARSQPGSGLGLAIVRQIADELDGQVSVGRANELGGARFTLSIPTVADSDDNSE
jgi:two-component system sensor histidine kinase MprB